VGACGWLTARPSRCECRGNRLHAVALGLPQLAWSMGTATLWGHVRVCRVRLAACMPRAYLQGRGLTGCAFGGCWLDWLAASSVFRPRAGTGPPLSSLRFLPCPRRRGNGSKRSAPWPRSARGKSRSVATRCCRSMKRRSRTRTLAGTLTSLKTTLCERRRPPGRRLTRCFLCLFLFRVACCPASFR